MVIRHFLLWIFFFCVGFIPCFALASPLVITEVDPVAESIEIHNTSSATVLLQGWQWSELTSSGSEKVYEVGSGEISAREFFIISSSRKINDTGDVVSLISPTGEKISVTVPEKQEGLTYQLVQGNWVWANETLGSAAEGSEEHEEDEQEDFDDEEFAEGLPEEESKEESADPDQNENSENTETEEGGTGSGLGEEFDEDLDAENHQAENTDEYQTTDDADVSDTNDESGEGSLPVVLLAGQVLLTEILPNPDGTDGNENEFFELYNAEPFPVNISGWKVEDASGDDYLFPENTVIQPYEYRAFFRGEMGITLNNSAEELGLYGLDGGAVSSLGFSESAESGFALVRIDPLGTPEWISFSTPSYSTVRPVYTDGVMISEMLANPEGSDGDDNEFFELWNNTVESVDVSGWVVRDAGGKSFLFPENTVLYAGEYRAFFKRETGITLNNSDESLTLFDPNGDLVSELRFTGSADEAWSFARTDERIAWTDTVTPNAVNSITGEKKVIVSDTSNRLFSHLEPSSVHDEIELLITTVSPNTKHDFVEVYCQQCDADLAGVRLRVDSVVYQIPENTVVQTGDYLRFVFGNETTDLPEKRGNTWVFSLSAKNLTSTDETIVLGKWDGEIFDAMCYADGNGNFISTEKKEVGQLHLSHAWNGDLKEWGCVSSTALPRNSFFSRINTVDTNTASDFIRSRGEDDSSNNDGVMISKVVLQHDVTQITLENRSAEVVNMQHWYFANEKKWMMNISVDELLLSPGQSLQVQWDTKKAKKYSRENMTLELRDPSGAIHDVLCTNQSKDPKEKSDSGEVISEWTSRGLWKKERKQPMCFEYFQSQEIHGYTREIFEFPSFVGGYRLEKKFLLDEDIAVLTEESDNIDSVVEHPENVEGDAISDGFLYTVEPLSTGVLFEGTVPKGVSKVRFSLPSKHLEWESKVKGGVFSTLLQKPFKKGRYAVDITLVHRDKTETPLKRQKVLLVRHSMWDALSSITVASVLPNPDGKDSGNELLTLKNTTERAGWMRGWTVEFVSGDRVKSKHLPSVFFQPSEGFSLQKPFLPSLKNTDTTLIIRDAWGKVVAQVSWEKARSGEYFGMLAPRYIPKTKTKKSSTKKSVTQKNSSPSDPTPIPVPKYEEKEGVIVSRYENVLMVQVGEEVFEYPVPEYLPYSDSFFAVGNLVMVSYKKGEMLEVVPAFYTLSTDVFVLGGDEVSSPNIAIVFSGIVLVLLGSGGLLWVQLRRKMVGEQ